MRTQYDPAGGVLAFGAAAALILQRRFSARAAFLLVIPPIHPKGHAGHPEDAGGGRDVWLAADAPRACCISVESMALAHPPPLVGAGRGGGSP